VVHLLTDFFAYRVAEGKDVPGEGGSDAQASRRSEAARSPGEWTQVHGDVLQTADVLFHLSRVHMVCIHSDTMQCDLR